DMGFIPDIEKIFSLVPPRRQTLFFSATMPNEIVRIVNTFLKDPERVEVSRPAQTAETIKQYIVRVSDGSPAGKRAALRAAINRDNVKNGIVFCNRKRDVDIVARSLQRHGFSAAPIHGDLAQAQRTKTLADFKSDQVRILVASDVAARGLDIPAVSHVFNFDIPRNADDYVHRIGRTGRAGLTGESVTLVTGDDKKSLANVAKLIGGEPETLVLDGAATPAPAARSASEKAGDAEGEVKASRSRRASRSKPRGAAEKSEDQAAAKAPPPAPAPANDAQKGKRGARQAKNKDVEAAGFGDHVPDFLLRSAFG
ncbi:MAG TPA: RNA helicase, partial [Oceanicaulis sp.]|nr:RNA helicase [Oceanicaulis sp.]